MVGSYFATFLLPRGNSQTEARDLLECLVPLVANACLLSNAASPQRKQNAFWKLLALGCTLLLASRLAKTYEDLVSHRFAAVSFLSNILPFLHMIPLMAAIGLAPHREKARDSVRYGFLDLLLLASFWVYLYVFFVLPWQIVSPDPLLLYLWNVRAFLIQTLVVVVGFSLLFIKTKGDWRTVYGNLAGATALYGLGPSVAFALNAQDSALVRSSCYFLSLVWMALTGVIGRGLSLSAATDLRPEKDTQWHAWLSMATVLSFPLLGLWALFSTTASLPIRIFRLVATLIAIFLCSALAFVRQHLANLERTKLVQQISSSLENVNRLQTQFMRSEKLAALGQLAAGAAHEINNPLAAILGYSDLLLAENEPATRPYALGQKIQEQARRTKTLVTNLLSFARQVPAEKQLLDLHTVLESAVRLRKVDIHNKNIRIEFEGRNSVLPAVRGDPNQLLQVFHHLIGNAADAMETTGGVLLIRALSEKSSVVIEFSDTGPGLKDPDKVFDPFYTTKPLGKGTGLGLSICYGILQEHGGTITGFNRPEGGCTFRLELPAALASLPRTPLSPAAHRGN